jgi:GNAT superfamily N-acetyltransferase
MGRHGSVIIRPAGRDDVGAMARLLLESAESQNARESLCVDAADLLREGFGDAPRFHALVAEVSGHIVGLALYYFNFSTWKSINGLHLEDLYVERAWRRRGIAAALMRELADVAVRHHCRRFQWFVLQSNDGARRFYVSLGAQTSDDWAFMQLDVTTADKDASA